jgi:hypothetical protein
MGRKPDWVKERPVSSSYYIGIGMSFKEYNPKDYQQKAMESALQDLASQIKISIQSVNIREIVEKNQQISEKYTSYLKTALAADLEGYELVDTWENDKEYWVYYRLHKAKYEAIRRAKIEKAKALALDYLTRADQFEKEHRLAEAIQFYYKGLEAIEKYASEPLTADYQGKEIYLMNELISRLQNSTSSIKFTSDVSEIQLKQGKLPKKPMTLQVVAEDRYGNVAPIKNFPVKTILNGAEIDTFTVTDAQGIARIKITKIYNYKDAKSIQFKMAIEKLFAPEIKSPILQGIISTLTLPEFTIYVRLIAATAYITGTEKNLNTPVSVLHIVPALKQALVDHGFQFVDNPSQADFIIKISANTVKGAKVYGLFTAFADVDVSVLNASTYKEVYREALHHIKGIQLDYEKAGLKALESAAKEVVQKVLPNIEKNLQ